MAPAVAAGPDGRFPVPTPGYPGVMSGQTVSVGIEVEAPVERVWQALTDPAIVQQYFFGTRLETTWEPGTPITWSGEYEGRAYADHGEVVEVVPPERLVVTHFSPVTGQPDVPENYHRQTYRLHDQGGRTYLRLDQDNTPPGSEAEFRENWEQMLANLKDVVEQG